jgi:hypothetical protein
MKPVVQAKGLVAPCCMPSNCVREQTSPDVVVERCRTCGRKHYTAQVRMGEMLVRTDYRRRPA